LPDTQRTIAVVTSSRADYSHLYWPLRALRKHPNINLRLIAMAAHLSPEFGHTIDDIEKDGFEIHERIECLLSSDSDVGMAKTIGAATMSLADALGRMRPDLLLLIADRYEMLAPASVALALRIPIAHIEGGEISAGAIDDSVRNALTKLSHVHFTPTRAARDRVIGMGESPWRVHHVGAPSLDYLKHSSLVPREKLETVLGTKLASPVLVAAYHPVTLLRDTTAEADAFFEALSKFQGTIVFCFPNADAGSRALVQRARHFCDGRDCASLHIHLPTVQYFSLLNNADLMAGNSSSGIMETASFSLPTVNVGFRQEGRQRARNIIDVPPDACAIIDGIQRALEPGFRAGLDGMENPYGHGHAGELIAEILGSVTLDDKLLNKHSDA